MSTGDHRISQASTGISTKSKCDFETAAVSTGMGMLPKKMRQVESPCIGDGHPTRFFKGILLMGICARV